MPEGVNSLGTPQCLQAYPSLPVTLSYSLPLSVTPHLIRSAPFPFGLIHLDYASIHPSFHLPLCLLPCLSRLLARPC